MGHRSCVWSKSLPTIALPIARPDGTVLYCNWLAVDLVLFEDLEFAVAVLCSLSSFLIDSNHHSYLSDGEVV